ncbi:MAG: glucokinase [Gammaproteobacteria bacterium]|nr:glucokinase [Gammaproteobacteria bacterium]
MRYYLAADLGGTKILFQLMTQHNTIVLEQEVSSAKFASFDMAVADFLADEKIKDLDIESACFAVAGPVSGRSATITNLPWQIDAEALAKQFTIKHVQLYNDFEAVAHGISCLADDEVITLQQGEETAQAPRAVIGAGTGLGQAIMLPEQDGWHVLATEGGHIDFAPTNSLEIALLESMLEQFGHVSYERVVSGVGLVTIYKFLLAYHRHNENTELRQAIISGDAAEAISQYALNRKDSIAEQALDMFIKIYGSQAGNLALTVLPMGGLYIAGGIAAKNVQRFVDGPFLAAFLAKGKMAKLMHKVPVRLILQAKVGLLGASLLARQYPV